MGGYRLDRGGDKDRQGQDAGCKGESTKTLAGRRTVKLLAPAREALLKQKELTFLAGGRVRESNVGRQASRPQRLDHDRQGVWSLDALR